MMKTFLLFLLISVNAFAGIIISGGSSGGGGTPGGSSGQIQYNNAGAFGGFTASGPVSITASTGVTSIIESYPGHIESPTNKTYELDHKAAFAGTINTLNIQTTSGTATAAVKINGTSVTGISAVSVTSTNAVGTASAANTFVAGDTITLVLSSVSSPVDLVFTVKYTR